MCVSLAPADFTGTIVYGGRRTHPQYGRVEVLGYQNTPANLTAGPNAMLLHLPAQGLTPGHFLPVGPYDDLLEQMVSTIDPLHGLQVGSAAPVSRSPAVHVFDHDVYTIVLAGDPGLIPAALDQVPPHKRPALSPELFSFYRQVFPGHSVALCCFDNRQAIKAKPLFLWYPAPDEDRIVLPALDCHSGEVPDLTGYVQPDHWVLFGTERGTGGSSRPVDFWQRLPDDLRAFLPDAVLGRQYSYGHIPNGDFAINLDDLHRGDADTIYRIMYG